MGSSFVSSAGNCRGVVEVVNSYEEVQEPEVTSILLMDVNGSNILDLPVEMRYFFWEKHLLVAAEN